jgi:hypothetical protein
VTFNHVVVGSIPTRLTNKIKGLTLSATTSHTLWRPIGDHENDGALWFVTVLPGFAMRPRPVGGGQKRRSTDCQMSAQVAQFRFCQPEHKPSNQADIRYS